MNRQTTICRLTLLCVAALATVSCGGGGGAQVAGIDRLGISAGAVSGFGSIFVNGVRYNTDRASFDIDDDAAGSSQDDLSVGDVVVVTFDPAAPTVALQVIGDEAVEGPVESVNVAASLLVVAGQTVFVSADTSFDDNGGVTSLIDIVQGDFVEVSGFIDADGSIRATRIEKKIVPGETEVHGVVSGLTASTFTINGLTIDYVSVPAVIDDDFLGGTFADGDRVEVKGMAFNNGVLLATKVEPDGFGFGAGGNDALGDFDEAELEGFITRFVSVTNFDIAGLRVTTDAGTVFTGGTSADLGLNVKVKVEGSVNSNGELVADEVDIRRSNDFRVTAQVDSVSAANSTLTLLGIEVRTTAQTRFEDKELDLSPFGIADIRTGDYVEVRGGADTGGAGILALLLERDDAPAGAGDDTELRALVDSVSRPLLTVAGVTVDTGSAVFRDATDTPISADAFFAAVATGDLVDIKGTETSATTLVADEVELED